MDLLLKFAGPARVCDVLNGNSKSIRAIRGQLTT